MTKLNNQLAFLLTVPDQLERARQLAHLAHQGQKRKYTEEDYIIHPSQIVDNLQKYTSCQETLAAAWLHDVVEDTFVNLDDIKLLFNENISNYVFYLTEPLKVGQGNRKFRKEAYIKQLSLAPSPVKLIKLLDIDNNIHSIFEHDKKYAPIYLKEKIDFLNVLTEADQSAFTLVENNLRKLLFKLSQDHQEKEKNKI